MECIFIQIAEHSTWSVEHGAWSVEHGAWSMEREENHMEVNRKNKANGVKHTKEIGSSNLLSRQSAV